MSGLIQKDICLLFQRSRVLAVLIGIGAIMGFSTDSSFVIGFLTLTCAILTVGTISYDEFDNGFPFLFTLPITQKTYVMSKYVFCLLGGLTGWCISVVVFICCFIIKGSVFSLSELLDSLAMIPVLGLIVAVMIPIQLKFGAEKGRIVMVAFAGGVWALVTLAAKILPEEYRISEQITKLDNSIVTIFLIVLCAAAIGVSYLISLHIMKKKEY